MRLTVMALSALALVAPAYADPHAGDFELTVESGQIVVQPRVLGGELAELVPGVWTTDAPGFDAEDGTFNPGTAVGFKILDTLRKWNGTDFSTQPTETLTLSSSVLNTTTPTNPLDAPVTGFSLTVSPGGGWHKHLNYTLNSPYADGIYLLKLSLFNEGTISGPLEGPANGLATESLPFWVVLNKNIDEEDHDLAIDYVNAVLVPEPASLGLLAAGALLALRRRRA